MELIDKCFRVIGSCETQEQLNAAARFINLAAMTKKVQSNSFRVYEVFIPLERAMAVKQYKISHNC